MQKFLSIKRLIITAAVTFALWLALGPWAAAQPFAARSAAVVLVTLVLWSTAVLPPFLTSLIFFTLVLILGLSRPERVFSGLGSTAVWLIISGFIIGAAISLSGLGRKMAELLAPLLAGSYERMIAGLTMASMALGFVMPSSTGRAVVLVPLGMALADKVGFAPGSKGRIGIAVTLALACNLPSFAILPANIPNMILAGASETLHHTSFGYLSYLLLHFPLLGLLKSAMLVGLVLWLFPARIEAGQTQAGIAAPEGLAKHETASNGQLLKVAVILGVTLVLWMTDSLHGVNPAWVGLAAAVVLLLPRVGVVPAKSFNASVDFGMVLFVAAALGLGSLVNESGLGKMVGEGLRQVLPLGADNKALSFYSLSAMSALTGLVTTIPGVPTVLTPMAPDLAAASGMSLSAVLMTQVLGFSTVIFPYQVGPLIVAMQLSGERIGSLVKVTVPLALLTFLVIVPLDYLWWRLLGWV